MLSASIPPMVRELPERWMRRVAERRALSATDPAADALERAAAELNETITAAQNAAQLLSSREYAAAHGMKQATVRKWCARGLLAGATHDGSGDWRIPATATRARRRPSRALRSGR